MHSRTLFTLLAAAIAEGRIANQPRAANPPYFVLVGDSTVAVDGGWGDGFLSYIKDPADGINSGKSGATTVSYRADGSWDAVLEAVADNAGSFEAIVTIQFGHNDQKEASGITLDDFQTNLEDLANEVTEAGGTPIIVTSLTRRAFDDDGVIENLIDQRERAIAAADAIGATYLDLNGASTNFINAIGEENGTYYDLSDGDSTHLNEAGQTVFGRMVADLLIVARDDLADYLEPDEALSDKIAAGEFATGDE